MVTINKLSDIVENGLCIGCGICQSIAGSDRVEVVMTPEGRQRPVESTSPDKETLEQITAVCPGTQIHGLPDRFIEKDTIIDPIWGPYLPSSGDGAPFETGIARGYAADPEVRFKASTGGVLSALALFLLDTGRIDFVLHVAASKQQPMRSERQISFDRVQVMEGAGSRYGPTAPLVDFVEVLDREQPFAFVGKPCDINAIRNLAKTDTRVDRYCRYCLTIFCGGTSELGKSEELLDAFDVKEEQLSLFRYRGYGNPGPTRLETKDGRHFNKNYNEFWEGESGWRLQFRCKICPDPNGESADLAAFDIWPDANPQGEDEGFNGIMPRTAKGLELLEAAVEAGVLIIDRPFTAREIDVFQPHQVRKKKAVWTRLQALQQSGQLIPEVSGLRIGSIGL